MLLSNSNKTFIEELLITTSSLGINYEFEGIRGIHLNYLIGYFQENFNLKLEEILEGIPTSFLKNKEFDKKNWFVNEVQFKIYENIEKKLLKQGLTKEEFYQHCYLSGIESRKKITNKKTEELVKFSGTSIENIISIPQEYASQTSLFRRIESSKRQLEDNLYEYTVNIKSFPGLKTPKSVVYNWFGNLDQVLSLTQDDILSGMGFHENQNDILFDNKTGNFQKKLIVNKNPSSTSFPNRRKLIRFLYPNVTFKNLKSKKKFEELEDTLNKASNWVFRKKEELTKRHENTGYHVSKVTFYTNLAMLSLGFEADQLRNGVLASLLHDKGKEAVIDKILLKKGAFSPLERIIMDDHGPLGTAMILQETLGLYQRDTNLEVFMDLLGRDLSKITFLDNIAEIARGTYEHHENCLGSGFLFRKKPEEISLIGKILQYADIFDAMLEDRPYKKGLSLDEAIVFMRNLPLGLLDQNVIKLFETHVIPTLKENFGSENISDNVNSFLEKENFEYDDLRNNILGLNNYSLEINDRFPVLKAEPDLRNWSKTHKNHQLSVDDLFRDNIWYFKKHFETLNLVARIENLITMQDHSFTLELPVELNKLIYDIDGRNRLPFRSVQNLSADSIKYLKKESFVNSHQEILIGETKESYLHFVPYLESAMKQKY